MAHSIFGAFRFSFASPSRSALSIAVVGCLALTAAGCGGDAAPDLTPSASHSASESAESKAASAPRTSRDPGGKTSQSAIPSTAVRLQKPTRADYPRINERNAAGASAALKYFIDGYRYGLLTGDPSPVQDFSTPECELCQHMVRDIKANGAKLTSAVWSTEDSTIRMTGEDKAVGARKLSSRTTRSGRLETQANIFYVGAQMEWSEGRWRGYSISVEDDE